MPSPSPGTHGPNPDRGDDYGETGHPGSPGCRPPGRIAPVGRHSVWELVFLMLILKIPIVYLCTVVVYAIRAEPSPEEGVAVTARLGSDDPDSGSGWSRALRSRRFRPRPHGGPSRTYSRSPRTAAARAEANRR